MLSQRVRTAIVLLVIFFGVLFSGSALLIKLLLGIGVALAAWEWAGLSRIQTLTVKVFYTTVISLLFGTLSFLLTSSDYFIVYLSGVGWWCIATIMVILFQSGRKVLPDTVIVSLIIGILILIPASVTLVTLYEGANGLNLFIIFFLLIWLVDSAAFFVGRKLGKHKLANIVSPGKSWEGFFAGIIVSLLFAIILAILDYLPDYHLAYLALLFIITTIFSVVGDLFESMFKRSINIKDSGNLLPGHGGILDRIDSITAAAPFYGLGLWLLENHR